MQNIFIPKKIKVGFQKRDGTYTGSLAYVIYYDEKNVLRKQTSWEGWRHKNIEPQDFDNIPTSGFVLNKKVGGYDNGWNHRQTYCRVYDPRGFEFEIDIQNLLYILENTNSIKGKGLEGDFVYGYEGKDLILIPCDSTDYKQLTEYNNLRFSKSYIKAKDLIIGAEYLTKQNEKWIYITKSDYYYYDRTRKGEYFWFYNDGYFQTIKTLSGKIMKCTNSECTQNYSEIFEKLECDSSYSPYDSTKDVDVIYSQDELKEFLSNRGWYNYLKISNNFDGVDISKVFRYNKEENKVYQEYRIYRDYYSGKNSDVFRDFGTIEEFIQNYKPYYTIKYLKNGRFYKKEYRA